MKNYIDERWPESNSKPHVFYLLSIEGHGISRYNTVDELRTAVNQCRYNKWDIKKAIRMAYGMPQEFTPETSGEQSARENRRQCKHIALELEAYTDGNVYRCPECGETHRLPDDVGDKYRCPDCETVSDLIDWDQCSLYDYFQDCLDIEYRVGGDKKYRSCQIMVTFGGPNIYIDTASKAVELYWWTERAEYPLSYDACTAVDEWAEEYWNI